MRSESTNFFQSNFLWKTFVSSLVIHFYIFFTEKISVRPHLMLSLPVHQKCPRQSRKVFFYMCCHRSTSSTWKKRLEQTLKATNFILHLLSCIQTNSYIQFCLKNWSRLNHSRQKKQFLPWFSDCTLKVQYLFCFFSYSSNIRFVYNDRS